MSTPTPAEAELLARIESLSERLDRLIEHVFGPRYRVGDPDPTPNLAEGEPYCTAETGPGWFCNWHRGHRGAHVASNGTLITAVWDDAEPTYHIGDPDPTPNDWVRRCSVDGPNGWFCTWPAGHPGVHVSGNVDVITAVWS